MNEIFYGHLHILLIALSMALAISLLAWRLGFFSPSSDTGKEVEQTLPWKYVALAFTIFIVVGLLLFPVLAGVWISLQPGGVAVNSEENFDPLLKGWFNVFSMSSITAILILFTSSLGVENWLLIWNRSQKTGMKRLQDFFFGVVTWTLAYPYVSCVGQLVALLIILFFPDIPFNPEQTAVKYVKGLLEFPLLFWTTAVVLVFVVPMTEELLFRGFLQSWLRTIMGKSKAIMLSSFLFAGMHYSSSQGVANGELLFSLFILSLFLGYLYERQRTLWAPIGLHAAFNAISIIMIFFVTE